MDFKKIRYRLINNKLITDSFWSLFGNVIAKGLALAGGIIVARFLGKDVFGEYGIIKNTILSIATFATFGLNYTVTKFIAEYQNKKPEYVKIIFNYSSRITLSLSALFAIILFLFADYIAESVLNAGHLGYLLKMLSFLIILNSYVSLQVGVLAGFGKFKKLAKINTVTGFIMFITSLSLAYFFGIEGALGALFITQTANCILNYFHINKIIPVSGKINIENKKIFKDILNFSTPVALQEAVYTVMQWINGILLINFATYGDFGMYTVAIQWNAIILFIPGILRNVILSHLSKANDDISKHSRIIKITILINFSMTLLPAIIVFVFSNYISTLYGDSFEGIGNLISISVFTTIFVSLSNVYAQAYMSKGLNWIMFLFKSLRDVGVVFATYYFLEYNVLSTNGALSLIVSSLCFSIIFLLLMIIYYRVYSNKNI